MKIPAILAAGLIACSSGSKSDPSSTSDADRTGDCVGRSGSYFVHYAYQSGNCGTVADSVIVLDETAASAVNSECANATSTSADNCDVTMDVTCANSTSSQLTQRGKISWSENGENGSGTIEAILIDDDGAQMCDGIYTISYSRQ